MTPELKKTLKLSLLGIAIAGGLYYAWNHLQGDGEPSAFVSGNGRIEAVEIDVATKLGGRVKEILVREGDFVQAGQVLGHMQVYTLQAQRDEALRALLPSQTPLKETPGA